MNFYHDNQASARAKSPGTCELIFDPWHGGRVVKPKRGGGRPRSKQAADVVDDESPLRAPATVEPHIAFATDFSEVFSLDPLAELKSLYTPDTTDAINETESSSWRELAEDLEGNENVAIAYYCSDDLDYYIVKLADDPWHVVPKGEVRDDDADPSKRFVLTHLLVATVYVVDFEMSGPVRQRRRVPRVY